MEEKITPRSPHFPAGKWEFWLLIAMAVCSVLIVDFALYGGLNLGFGLMSMCIIVLSTVYLRKKKHGPYCTCLLVLNLIIAASFLRSDDGLVKFVMLCFLLLSGNLHLSLLSGQNRRKSSDITSLLDAPRAFFYLGFGQMGNAMGGLNDTRKNAGTAVKKNMAVLTGLAIAVPVLAILIPLLMKADAAFEGLLNLLPHFDLSEAIIALMFGLPLACVLYTRNTALKHKPKEAPSFWAPRRFNPLTVNTVLIMVCLLYLVYLISQLAYFVGGFSGILPEDFTLAQYARRGFFEMAWLAAINLGIMTVSVGLTEKTDGCTPLLTRLLCLFVGIVTLFFTVAASAKMLLYIDSFGLTRLRLLTEVIMIFIALTVIFVAIWLFKPKFAYMKAVLLTALLMGSCVAWADVDTVVAAYNVNAYQTGQLETIDVSHLSTLGDGAVPYIEKLAKDPNQDISQRALRALVNYGSDDVDLRSFNIASSIAEDILEKYRVDTEEQANRDFQP